MKKLLLVLLLTGIRDSSSGTGSAAARSGECSLHRGVLLQDAVGPSTGISGSLSEESFPFAAKDSADRPHHCVEDRDARQPHDGRRALGLSGDDYL